ncbi:MAG TPA: hypothetical protein VG122_07775, partial [Gemmata sp.]|nr:hypothetical protein [Gemmata sp.]
MISPGCFLDLEARNVDTYGRNAPAAAYQPVDVRNSILVPLLSVASRVGEQTMRSLNKMIWAALI